MGQILPALVLNQPYAMFVKEGKKTIETRMRRFHHWKGGELVICMGQNNDHPLAGKAICVVEMATWRTMEDKDAEGACIENAPGRYAYDLSNLRQLSYNFNTPDYAVQKNYQGIFTVQIPDFAKIFS
jgi:hypothetical protein